MPRSLERLRSDREVLQHFHEHYLSYLSALASHDEARVANERREANKWLSEAHWVLAAYGPSPSVLPPPAVGGPVMNGLANVAFLHERSDFGTYDQVPRMAVDCVEQGLMTIGRRIEEEERRRKKIWYWPDRIVTGVLGIPAYVVSGFLGVRFDRVDGARVIGPLLRLVGFLGSVASIWGLGAGLGWW